MHNAPRGVSEFAGKTVVPVLRHFVLNGSDVPPEPNNNRWLSHLRAYFRTCLMDLVIRTEEEQRQHRRHDAVGPGRTVLIKTLGGMRRRLLAWHNIDFYCEHTWSIGTLRDCLHFLQEQMLLLQSAQAPDVPMMTPAAVKTLALQDETQRKKVAARIA